jgi:hypothetical protein
MPDYYIYFINLTLCRRQFSLSAMLLRALLRTGTAPIQPKKHQQRTFHHTPVVAVIPLQIVSKMEGTQAGTTLITQVLVVQTTYPKG